MIKLNREVSMEKDTKPQNKIITQADIEKLLKKDDKPLSSGTLQTKGNHTITQEDIERLLKKNS